MLYRWVRNAAPEEVEANDERAMRMSASLCLTALLHTPCRSRTATGPQIWRRSVEVGP